MTVTERLLKAIAADLAAIRAVLAPDTTVKPKGGASVGAFNKVTGEITDDGGDVPEQLTAEQKRAMRWQADPHPIGKRRTETRRL